MLKKIIASVSALAMLVSLAPSAFAATTAANETKIVLSDTGITVDGATASANTAAAVYVGADIVYYKDGTDSVYGAGSSAEMHTAAQAEAQTVVTITKAGTYRVSGKLSAGQLAIDLGDSAKTDPNAVVTLILDGANITCDVAPAVIFYNVYECGSADTETATSAVDTTAAGANVIIADGSTNNINGSHVAKIYKTDTTPKIKYDGAFYSCMSMNVTGEAKDSGILNIVADNEGLDSELHLTINGGNINIYAQNDGINTNEDGVSVTTINGGCLHICAGLGAEGDGIDSNGWLVINGGTVIATANPASDSGLDADKGAYVNGGTVVALGSTMDWAESESEQVTINLQFASMQNQDEAIVITDQSDKVVFAYDPDQDEVTGANIRSYQGAVVSCAAFETGKTYYVYLGGTLTGTETKGVYDVSTITDYQDGVQQVYTGTDVGKMFGGGMGNRPEGGNRPDGSIVGDNTGTPPEKPTDGTIPNNGNRPTLPDGAVPDDSNRPTGGATADGSSATTATSSVYFYLSDKVNAFSGVGDNAFVSGFTDVINTAWYADAVTYNKENGLMSGTTATTFGPAIDTTRAMVVTILYRLEGSPAVSGDLAFTDVAAGTYYTDAILWATQNGIVSGYGNGTFCPTQNITRQELAMILYHYASYKGLDVSAVEGMAVYEFSDWTATSDYAKNALRWAYSQGLITGTSATAISPTASAVRAQVATTLMRYCTNVATAA